jgi:hypothetical protein
MGSLRVWTPSPLGRRHPLSPPRPACPRSSTEARGWLRTSRRLRVLSSSRQLVRPRLEAQLRPRVRPRLSGRSHSRCRQQARCCPHPRCRPQARSCQRPRSRQWSRRCQWLRCRPRAKHGPRRKRAAPGSERTERVERVVAEPAAAAKRRGDLPEPHRNWPAAHPDAVPRPAVPAALLGSSAPPPRVDPTRLKPLTGRSSAACGQLPGNDSGTPRAPPPVRALRWSDAAL